MYLEHIYIIYVVNTYNQFKLVNIVQLSAH